MGRSSTNAQGIDVLLRADIDDIFEKYGDYLKSYTQLRDRESTYANFKKTSKKLEVLFLLIQYPIHGITGIHAMENYDKFGHVRQYQYQWKIIVSKMGIQTSHIMIMIQRAIKKDGKIMMYERLTKFLHL